MYVYVRLTQCIARRIPEQCHTFQQHDPANEVSARLARLETILETGLGETSRRIDMLAHEIERVQRVGVSAGAPSVRRTGSPMDTVHALHHAAGSESESDDNAPTEHVKLREEPLPAMMAAAGNFASDDRVHSGPSQCPMDPRDDLDMNTISPAMQESLSSSMYPKEVSLRLIEVYLETINLYRHPIPKDLIFTLFHTFYNDGGVVSAERISQFGLLAALCSIGALYVSVSHPEWVSELSKNGSYDELDASKRLCNAAQIACFMAQNMSREDVYTVLTYTHLSRLFFVRGQIELSWNSTVNCVRVALGIGLHRDGEAMGLDPETTQLRRIVWSLVYSIERTTSLGYGRPMIISDAVCDTRAPELRGDASEVPEGLRALFTHTAPPNLLLINNLRSKLAVYIGDLAFEVQNVHKTVSYSRILQIHVAFNRSVVDELPFYFQIRLKDNRLLQNTQCDAFYDFVKIQRYQLWLDFNFFMLALHCPFLLRYNPRRPAKYVTSYDACLEAVKLNLALRRELLVDQSLPQRYRDTMAGFRWFNTVIVGGFILLKRPSQEDAALLTAYMNDFLTWRAQHRGARHAESEKEMQIVRAFLERANSSTEEFLVDHPSVASSGSPDESPAHKRTRLDNGGIVPHMPIDELVSQRAQPGHSAADVHTWRQQPAVPGAPVDNAPEASFSWPNAGKGDASAFPPLNVPYSPNIASSSTSDLDKLNLLYSMPMITPNVALNPQTLMPVWPQNTDGAPLNAPFFSMDAQQQNLDTQQLLDLW